jgi:hypothetical protein
VYRRGASACAHAEHGARPPGGNPQPKGFALTEDTSQAPATAPTSEGPPSDGGGAGDTEAHVASSLGKLNAKFAREHGRKTEARKQALADPRSEAEQNDRQHRRQTVEKYGAVLEHNVAGDRAFVATRELRQQLKELLPEMSLKQTWNLVEQVNAGLETNPAATCEWLRRTFLARPPQFGRDDAPKDRKPEDKTKRGALERAVVDVEDRAHLKEALLKHGGNVEKVLRQTVGTLRMLIDDPIGGAARIEALYSPVTPSHRAEVAQAQQHQQAMAQLVGGIQNVIAAGKLPGLETLQMQNEVINVLTDRRFQRTGHAPTDLYRAWQHASAAMQRAGIEATQRKAGLSVHGSPGANAPRSGQTAGASKSIREALVRAIG